MKQSLRVLSCVAKFLQLCLCRGELGDLCCGGEGWGRPQWPEKPGGRAIPLRLEMRFEFQKGCEENSFLPHIPEDSGPWVDGDRGGKKSRPTSQSSQDGALDR